MRGKICHVRSKMWLCAVCIMLLLTACSQDDDTVVLQPARHWVQKTVAVVAPIGDAATKIRLERTADWFLQNFREAQKTDTLAIDLKIVWHDELSTDLAALSETLANDSNVIAIIGPFSNEGVAEFAPACMKKQKPLIAPTATSEDIIRRYAVSSAGRNINRKPFLWSLTETDVQFTNLLMSAFATQSKYYQSQFKDTAIDLSEPMAAIFSPDDAYGMTFNYWAPFYAEQDDIRLQRNLQYRSTADLLSQLNDYRPVMQQSPLIMSGIFCAVETAQQMYEVARANRQAVLNDPALGVAMPSTDPDDPANDAYWQQFKETYKTYFAYAGLSEESLEALGPRGTKILQGYEGFSPYAAPSTGFELSYKKRFDQLPTFAECKFYDALMLTAFAACYVEHQRSVAGNSVADINQAIIAITTATGSTPMGGSAWSVEPMRLYLSAMEDGRLLHFIGASGEIGFASDTYTASTTTAYVHWQIFDGKILHRRYFGTTGRRTVDAGAAWLYFYNEQEASEDFQEQAGSGSEHYPAYPALTDQYAVLVQGSEGISCYRHQADVLNVYQALRRDGFDDDHIILIIDKEMAQELRTTMRGTVRIAVDGKDLLGGTDGLPVAVVDYDNANLTARDVADILTGKQSARLHTVLPQGEGYNVLFYWSGHGRSGEHGGSDEFVWRDTEAEKGFTADLMRQTASQMQYRKLLIAAEPCFGENVIRAIKGIDGVLAISGASGTEQSWADHWNDDARLWMCDRFSLNLVDCMTEKPETSFRDLFLYCAQHTLGSHAKIVNADHFGNLYTTGPAEFIRYNYR